MKKNQKDILLQDWLDTWYEIYAKPFVKKSTLVSYECYIRLHIKSYIGNIKLCDFNTMTFQRFFNQQFQNGSCKGTALSPKTIYNLRMMLHEAIGDAVKNDLMKCNYIEYVKLPKLQKEDQRVLTKKEQAKLLTTLKASDDPFAFGVFFCLATGIRLGELCGLRWSDFSEHNGKVTVHIQRTLNRIPDLEKGTGTIINISAPKTKAANRIIPLNQTVVEFLKKHWMKQTELLGKEYATGDHYVLSRIPNKPVEPKFMQMRFKRFLCESHITDANFHALRHTFATRALEANVDYKTLSVLLGHANVTTTMNLYQHILLDQKIVAMEKILQQF